MRYWMNSETFVFSLTPFLHFHNQVMIHYNYDRYLSLVQVILPICTHKKTFPNKWFVPLIRVLML
jgi:hypothetical protein